MKIIHYRYITPNHLMNLIYFKNKKVEFKFLTLIKVIYFIYTK
ncbi:hypothetical protein XIS1_1640018 [Xenorhabdus innexi]|uniref:Uncharacterized protein n=1 Tax=Xenorhabdus innexi TaxID=290109 RepID=A0A1N6MV82_9GAMM|nr:hypothetical protein XIS1_1640018 [Xenorhabdus innexi]